MQEERSATISIEGVDFTERDARELLTMFKSPAYRNSYARLLKCAKEAEAESMMGPGLTNEALRERVGGMKVHTGWLGLPEVVGRAVDEFDSLRQE